MSDPVVPDTTAAPPPDPAGPAAGRSRSVRLLVGLAAAVVVVAGLKAFSGTIGPAFLALVLVIVVHPLGTRLQRLRLPTWVSVAVNLVVAYLVVLGLAASLAWAAVELATTLPQYAGQLLALRNSTLDLLEQIGVDQAQLVQMVNSADPYQLLGYAQTLVSGLTAGLTDFTFVLLLLFFLLLDAAPFPRLLSQAEWSHPDAVEAMRTFAAGTRRYLVVSTVFGAIVAVMDVVALAYLGVPLALLWGLVSFVTNYVANIGFLLGLVPPALLALLANGPENALLVVIVYTVINVVVQGLVQPKIVGDAVGLSASLTFLSVVFWGFVLGGLGALLAVPLSLLARAVLVDADPSARWLLPLVAGSSRGVPQRPQRTRGAGRLRPGTHRHLALGGRGSRAADGPSSEGSGGAAGGAVLERTGSTVAPAERSTAQQLPSTTDPGPGVDPAPVTDHGADPDPAPRLRDRLAHALRRSPTRRGP